MPRVLAMAMMFAAVAACGCGKGDKTKTVSIPTSDGAMKMDVTQNGDGGMTIESPDGKVVYTADGKGFKSQAIDKDGKLQTMDLTTKVDLAIFGNLRYPGATLRDENAASALKLNDTETTTAQFLTTDSRDALVEHYKKIPGATVTSLGDYGYVSGTIGEGATYSLTFGPDQDSKKTSLFMSVTKKT